MKIICADAETYFADDFTLSKMTTESYIRDKRFEVHGWAIKWGEEFAPRWYSHEQAKYIFTQEDWSDIGIIAHHAQFDGLILSHVYNVKPKLWFDTLSYARMLIGNHLSVSLDSLAKHFNLQAKIVPYHLFKNKHWHELSPDIQEQVANGACHDVNLTWQLFKILGPQVPREEFEVVDEIIRMFTEPSLEADVDMLARVWEKEEIEKAGRLAELNVDASELQSAEKFAALLRAEGIEPETKNGKNGAIYAFAKTDSFMQELREHDNPRVALLAQARLGEKSTLLQTRAESLGWKASRGALPVYLRYCGTGTLRVSGGDGDNWLNFKRGSMIRKAIKAREGYKLGPIDASQIEFRVAMWLAKQDNVLDQLRRNEDPYVDIASEFYGERIYKPEKTDPRRLEMEQKRGTGKQAKLMCQYGAAGAQFQKTARAGLYGPPVDMSREDADRFVELYRRMHPAICAKNSGYWAQCDRMIARLAGGPPVDWDIFHVRDHRIYLPSGQVLVYDSIEFHVPDDTEECRDFERSGYWRMRTRHGWKKMWGSKLFQNLCEAVSRVIVSQAMIRVRHMGYRIRNWPYDELLIEIPADGNEHQHLERCRIEMCRTPEWLPGLPLDAEASLGERYSK